MADQAGRPPTVTSKQLGQVFGIDERSVRRLAAEDHIVKEGRDRYAFIPSITKYVTHLREQAAGRSSSDPAVDTVREGALLKRTIREQKQMLAERTAGTLVDVDAIDAVMAEHIGGIQRAISEWPDLCQAEMPHIADVDIEKMRELAKRVLRNLALRELAATGKHPDVQRVIERQKTSKRRS